MTRMSLRRRSLSGLAILAAATVAAGGLLAGPVTAALAAPGDVVVPDGQLAVTFVSRVCPEYSDIMANRARNNIQESLRDLGKDSVYVAGEPVTPAIEGPNDPNCTPLPGWDFQLGTAIQDKTAATDWLSTLNGTPFPDSIRTQPGPIPELDARGIDTGRTIDGAVTVTLSSGAAEWVRSGRQLWAQGGTQSQPLPPGGEFGFGALRCSVDNLNGDNVEYVSFPTIAGTPSRHVFCYYYAVTPPPEAGTITVVKQLEGVSGDGAETFTYEGNISYDRPSEDEAGRFTLSPTATTPSSISFIRGAVTGEEPPWTFRELPQEGWEVFGTPACTTELDSPWTYSSETGFAVSLRAGDVVTCTFVNTRTVFAALFKQTVGAVGTFPFVVETPDGTSNATVTTTAEREPVLVESTEQGTPGIYTATETLPAADAFGSWALESATCIGDDASAASAGQQASVTVEIGAGEIAGCLLTNRYTSSGAIIIDKTSIGGVGEFNYSIAPADSEGDSDPSYLASATTTQDGATVVAEPSDGSAPATDLAQGSTWTIQEFAPAPTAQGHWQLDSVDCGGLPGTSIDPRLGTVTVTIPTIGEAETPVVECSFVNEFVATAQLQVVKTTSGDSALRPGVAQIQWACGTQAFDAEIAPGETVFTSPVDTIEGSLTCVASEPATGAADGVQVTTTAQLVTQEGGEPTPYTLGDEFELIPGETAVLTIDNAFAAPSPTPTPTPSPTRSPQPLPATGLQLDAVLWIALGAGAVVLGGIIFLITRRRGSRDDEARDGRGHDIVGG